MRPEKSIETEIGLQKPILSQSKSTARCNFNGGIIIEVTSVTEAILAQTAGASCVVAVEKFHDGINRMSDPSFILQIKKAVSIPVMAKARVGHSIEAKILEAIGVNFIDENELLGIADRQNFTDKKKLKTPFVSGCRDIGQALRSIKAGAIMIRLQGTGDISDTVEIIKSMKEEIDVITYMEEHRTLNYAERTRVTQDVVMQTKKQRRLPVLQLASGGIITPADVAFMMELGCDGVFVGSEIFDGKDPFGRAVALVKAMKHYKDPKVLAEISCGFFREIKKESELKSSIEDEVEVD
ncbi:pyridoxal 5'-phosphate synthase-like subunit PDX1.2 [Impatiens glandulifera]|uniref:pyridoxal 5'-phosphate synthase-like subunit PDX1.2 n=1 Tax=Impatiens glandulifera TaxID=253017 RepID=UPI001FB083DA|nr:pyridoxal 5'-phosphate synthase-like subunit PDX1.2 [Impatiens glandulifera]